MRKIREFMGGFGNRLFQFAFLYSQVREGKLPDIYLQDYTIFDKYKEELKEIFKVPKNYFSSNVSLHIRRGDYVNNPFYVDLTKTDYYQRAVLRFPDAKFHVFCHDGQDPEQDKKDKEWCREFLDSFIKGRYSIHSPVNEIHDFDEMACCKGHIMANSSFSFWASYLEPRPTMTIAPKEWFANGTVIELPDNFEVI